MTNQALKAANLAATPSPQIRTKMTKKDQLLDLLRHRTGAGMPAMAEQLAWQPHTVRSAISRLRKQGHNVELGNAGSKHAGRYKLLPPAKTKVAAQGVA